jgi:hypothetical protein
MVAVGLGTLVTAGMLTVFIWSLRTASECRQYAWAQTEAIKTSQRIVSYLRNASVITNIDLSGNWVEVVTDTNGTIARISYDNPTAMAGEGRILLTADVSDPNSPTNILVHGVNKVMTLPVRNIFERTGDDSLRLAFRITKPLRGNAFPAEVDVGVRLRN